jgi:intron-binding protein aquarius
MTVTYATLTQQYLHKLGLAFDTVVVEEAGQMLEAELLVGLACAGPRVKRCLLLGDHYQLPPVVHHKDLKSQCHLDVSFFARLINTGHEYVQLDAQGRCRESIAKLWNWRYPGLSNLPSVVTSTTIESAPSLMSYGTHNAGFLRTTQLVDVGDLDGKGEICNTPYNFENKAEAEYVVACFMYMRMLGYSADSVVILTAYNAQKRLIEKILKQRCSHPVFGSPRKVSTIDQFQGQQAAYVLVSLVRTKVPGHLRDPRRVTVALSRACLGLYVFCRVSVLAECPELEPFMNRFYNQSQGDYRLNLVVGEGFPSTRAISAEGAENTFAVPDVVTMGQVVAQMADSLYSES